MLPASQVTNSPEPANRQDTEAQRISADTHPPNRKRLIMNTSYVGLFAGLILGVVAVTGGFLAFLGVAALGALGMVVGLIAEGRLDISGITGTERRRR